MIYSTSNKSKKYLTIYIVVTLLCGIFSFVYEYFSHQVYSNFMVYLFTIPLILGVIPQSIVYAKPKLETNNSWQKIIHNFAIATLISGSILQGIVEIYGTTSSFIIYFFIAGIIFLIVSMSLFIISHIKSKHEIYHK